MYNPSVYYTIKIKSYLQAIVKNLLPDNVLLSKRGNQLKQTELNIYNYICTLPDLFLCMFHTSLAS